MRAIALDAPAKLNLVLHVGPALPDGHHPVTTLLVALDGLADRVTVRRAGERRVTCPGVDGPANLAWRALDVLEDAIGRPMALHVAIEKRIPSPAGLGGGSSDAAATMRAARALLDLPLEDGDLERLAARIGSDVPFFVRGGAQWGTGRGEVLAPAARPGFWGVLTRPAGVLPTAAVYRRFDMLPAPPPAAGPRPVTDWRTDPAVRNDLWPAALALAPALGGVARALRAAGARRVLLCGSGAAMAGLWDTEGAARAGAEALGDRALAVVSPAVSL